MKKPILLFLALLFPACIFIFLKFFGRNEFAVPPLYSDTYPEGVQECQDSITLPYHVPERITTAFFSPEDSLILFHFGESTEDSKKQLERVSNEFGKEIKLQSMQTAESDLNVRNCIFFLKEPYDLVLVDREGLIRGQYVSDDREEIDRLLMEGAILLKKY